MRKFLRRLKKGFKTACLTTALVTCWNIGNTAYATLDPPPNLGDEVTIQFSGTIIPDYNGLSNVFLIYVTGASDWQSDFSVIKLDDFTAGQQGTFSVQGTAVYQNEMRWMIAGLYGDLSSGQYAEGINGVSFSEGIGLSEGDPWNSNVSYKTEEWMFNALFNEDIQSLADDIYRNNIFWYSTHTYLEFDETKDIYNFSQASLNGTVHVQSETIPEPISIILFGGGFVIVMASRRRKD